MIPTVVAAALAAAGGYTLAHIPTTTPLAPVRGWVAPADEDVTSEPLAPEAARERALDALLTEHGIEQWTLADYQPCDDDRPERPTTEEDSYTVTGCYWREGPDDTDMLQLSRNVLDPRVPWGAVRALALHEAAHRVETDAGCPDVRTPAERERLADAIAHTWGVDLADLTGPVGPDDIALAERVLNQKECL